MAQYPPEGYVLAKLANLVFWLGYNFNQLNDWCRDKPVIGGLADEFRDLRDWCWGAKDYLLERDVALWMTVNRVHDLFEGWAFGDILSRLWGDWMQIRDDPIYYGRKALLRALGRSEAYALDWGAWLRQVLDVLWPDGNRLRDDPGGFIRARLGDILASINEFLNDPVGRIVAWLNQRAEWFTSFLSEPWRRILTFAQNANAELYEWLKDPVERMKTRLSDLLGLPGGFWADPIRVGLEWLLDALTLKFALYRDTLYRKVHDLLFEIIEREYW